MATPEPHRRPSPGRPTRTCSTRPAHLVAEIINGTLHTHPRRPAAPHARAASALGGKIGTPFDYDADGPGGWWIIDEPELHLGEEILVPRPRRMAPRAHGAVPDPPPTSPSRPTGCAKCSRHRQARSTASRSARRTPAQASATCGSSTRIERTLEVFELHEGHWLLIASAKDDEPVSIRPFDAITFSLADLWTD